MDVPLSLFTVFVLPGEIVELSVSDSSAEIHFSGDTAILNDIGDQHWQIEVPVFSSIISLSEAAESLPFFQLNILVLQPSSDIQAGYLDQYRIGQYPKIKEEFGTVYTMPKGFLRVTPRMVDMQLTPNLILRRFISKQKSEFPKYTYVNEKLLLLLESFLAEVKKQGYEIDSFSFVSGFRTPYYNQSIGNIEYSRHIFGDAADIYIDANGDHKLDDLNRDGQINASDSKFLIGLAERFKKSQQGAKFLGGIGYYPPSKTHGGFVHLDTRGYKARW